MEKSFYDDIWKQFGAGLDMLANAIHSCPEHIWQIDGRFSKLVYHTLFFLDYYLTLEPVGFSQPDNFTYSEFDSSPETVIFPKKELETYLNDCRAKARNFIFASNALPTKKRWVNESQTMDFSLLELLLYNLRHVQHHVGQLNLLLRETTQNPPEWIFRAEN